MSSAQPQPILPTLTTNWWALFLRGIVAVLFGLAALFWPGLTLFTLIVFFGAYTLVDGIFAIVAGIRGSGNRRWPHCLLLAWHDGAGIPLCHRGVGDLYGPAEGGHGYLAAAGNRQRVDDGLERLALGPSRRGPDRPAGCRTAFPSLAHRSICPRSRTDAAGFGFQGARTARQRQGHLN